LATRNVDVTSLAFNSALSSLWSTSNQSVPFTETSTTQDFKLQLSTPPLGSDLTE
jgi:hypothetical protein